jgi:hypothetical protein
MIEQKHRNFNAHDPGGLIDKKAPGQPSKLEDAHRAALVKPHLNT